MITHDFGIKDAFFDWLDWVILVHIEYLLSFSPLKGLHLPGVITGLFWVFDFGVFESAGGGGTSNDLFEFDDEIVLVVDV